jgi:hypothetical protein
MLGKVRAWAGVAHLQITQITQKGEVHLIYITYVA